jgi:hypothetical protein
VRIITTLRTPFRFENGITVSRFWDQPKRPVMLSAVETSLDAVLRLAHVFSARERSFYALMFKPDHVAQPIEQFRIVLARSSLRASQSPA